MDHPKPWWGEFTLDPLVWGRWQIGPLTLWCARSEHEWRTVHAREPDPLHDASAVDLPADPQPQDWPAGAEQRRVGYSVTDGRLRLQPLPADRPVVAKPENPFDIPAGERVSVFVSSSVWVRVTCGSAGRPLIELPAWRPSDTWFGNNQSGYLAYSTRTTLRLQVEELPARPHRAVTPIEIDNRGKDTLHIERLSLPAPNLSIWASPAGALWTERLKLVREEDAELARVRVERDVPPRPGARRLSEARELGEDNLLSRVFTGLFG